MSTTLTLDQILDSIYYPVASMKNEQQQQQREAKQAILQWVSEEVVGEDEHYDKSDPMYRLQGEPFAWAERNQHRNQQRQTLKDHGWKPEGEKDS